MRRRRPGKRLLARWAAVRAAQDFSLQRLAVARAESESELKIASDTIERMNKEWDYALYKNLVSYRAASQARINIQTDEIDATISARSRRSRAVPAARRFGPRWKSG